MKFLNKTILKRNRSDPSLRLAQPPRSSSKDHMTIDLAKKDSISGLRMIRLHAALSTKVKTAVINVKSYVWLDHAGGEVQMNEAALKEVFECLGDLPNLHKVAIDLCGLELPVAAFTALFQGSNTSLRELRLMNLCFSGSTAALDQALSTRSQLTRVKLIECKGTAVQSLMRSLPALKKLELRDCSIGAVVVADNEEPAIDVFTALGQSSTLESLSLREVEDIKTDHILNLVYALWWRQESRLTELHITSSQSSLNGAFCGPAIADLLIRGQPSIRVLTLNFGTTWPTAGTTMARVVDRNRTLQSLCLHLAGPNDAATAQAREIVRALHQNTSLKRLKFCFDMNRFMDGPLDSAFLEAVETMLVQHNHSLHHVTLLGDTRDEYRLSSATRHKLMLNASHIPLMLHSGLTLTQSPADYLKTIIDSKGNLDVVYYALCNNPQVLLQLPATTSQKTMSSPNTSLKGEKPLKAELVTNDDESSQRSSEFDDSLGTMYARRKKVVKVARQRLFELLYMTPTNQ